MNARLALQRLWWKEVRQLLPLVTLLPSLALLLQAFYLFNDDVAIVHIFRSGNILLLLFVPFLFAVGAGALLVGQEKEQRTLQWLASLPIASRSIVRVKLGVGLIGLLVLWLFSVILFAPGGFRSRPPAAEIQWHLWHLNSVFVLCAGYALAWWSRSALIALLLVVPVATVPYFLAMLVDSLAPWGAQIHDKPGVSTFVACQVASSVVALWLADRLGQRSLGPESARSRTLVSWLPARDRYLSDNARAGYGRIQAPLPALLWQFILQSKVMLSGTAIMLLIAVGLIAIVAERQSPVGWMPPVAMLLTVLATCWLGVSVFQSDSVHGRIRFLADRGITPRLVWLTRQIAPASVVALFALLAALAILLPSQQVWQNLSAAATASLMYLIALTAIYLFSQWIGQIIPSPIVSTVAAPFVAMAVIAYGVFALHSLGASWGLVLLVALIPLVATLTMTRRWMDRRFGVSYWFSHFGFLAAVIAIPWIPLLISVASQPGMPSEVAQQLDTVTKTSPNYPATPTELVIGSAGWPGEDAEPLETQWEQQLETVEYQLSLAAGRPIGVSSVRVLERLWSITMLTRLALEQDAAATADSPAITDERQQTLALLYGKSIDLLAQVAQRMRLSPRIVEQDVADLIEIALLQQLRDERAVEWMGNRVYRTTAARLADRAGRERARAQAIAYSWQVFEEDLRDDSHPPGMFGGYNLVDTPTSVGTIRGSLLSKRRVGAAAAELWELFQGKERAATEERLLRIARYWQKPASHYGIGAAGSYLRANDLDRFVHPGFHAEYRGIASQWYADWERQASELAGG